jgi:hypothetical protein
MDDIRFLHRKTCFVIDGEDTENVPRVSCERFLPKTESCDRRCKSVCLSRFLFVFAGRLLVATHVRFLSADDIREYQRENVMMSFCYRSSEGRLMRVSYLPDYSSFFPSDRSSQKTLKVITFDDRELRRTFEDVNNRTINSRQI